MFSHLSPWKCQKCVLKPSEQGLFIQDNQFEGSHAYIYLKNECFPIYLLGNPAKCVLKSSEQGSFFQDDRFEGSHAYVYSQNEHFPIYLLGNPKNVCWNPQNRACFSRWLIWGVTCLGLLSKWMFCYLSPWKPHKFCVETLRTGIFLQDNQFEGSHAYIYLKMNVFQSISLETPKMCVEILRTGLVFQDNRFEGSHA